MSALTQVNNKTDRWTFAFYSECSQTDKTADMVSNTVCR